MGSKQSEMTRDRRAKDWVGLAVHHGLEKVPVLEIVQADKLLDPPLGILLPALPSFPTSAYWKGGTQVKWPYELVGRT